MLHGDVGPGNFMVHEGKLSAVLDWELAHAGDVHEDLAWHVGARGVQHRFWPAQGARGRVRACLGPKNWNWQASGLADRPACCSSP